jgi:hypothetical protein
MDTVTMLKIYAVVVLILMAALMFFILRSIKREKLHQKVMEKLIQKRAKELEHYTKKVKRSIKFYFEDSREGSSFSVKRLEIYDVEVKSFDLIGGLSKKPLQIKIELARPGILIGKAGADIEGLRKILRQDFNCEEVEIEIVEKDIWSDIYSYDFEFEEK